MAVLWPAFIFLLQVLEHLGVDFGDIWVPGGSGVTVWSIVGAWGVPGWTVGVQYRFLIDVGSPLGVTFGSLLVPSFQNVPF